MRSASARHELFERVSIDDEEYGRCGSPAGSRRRSTGCRGDDTGSPGDAIGRAAGLATGDARDLRGVVGDPIGRCHAALVRVTSTNRIRALRRDVAPTRGRPEGHTLEWAASASRRHPVEWPTSSTHNNRQRCRSSPARDDDAWLRGATGQPGYRTVGPPACGASTCVALVDRSSAPYRSRLAIDACADETMQSPRGFHSNASTLRGQRHTHRRHVPATADRWIDLRQRARRGHLAWTRWCRLARPRLPARYASAAPWSRLRYPA